MPPFTGIGWDSWQKIPFFAEAAPFAMFAEKIAAICARLD
jgi:hypothetical protein